MSIGPISRRAALGGLLTAGAFPAIAPAQPAAGTPIPVTIANASGNLNATMQELMNQSRFLQEFGLQPTILSIADGAKITAGIIGGEIDITMMTGFAQVFPAVERGAGLKVLGGASLLPALALFTAKPEVRTLKDLEGRTVGSGSVGSLLHQLTVAAMLKQGVDINKVRFINIGDSASVFRAVAMGTVDAGISDNAIIDRQEELKVRLVEHGNLAVELPEYTYQGAYASDAAIARRRPALVRSLAAYAKLYRFVQRPEAKDAFMRAWNTLYPSAGDAGGLAIWGFVQRYRPFTPELVLSEERLDYMQRLNMTLKTQTRLLPFAAVADMSLAREAVAMLG
ncbi:ABC transporter substrate-binding protein [Roseomonas elaeocarpi]|uniref:ABC transporter substrate-binding protein n=1 Tax=Roseomonas elaeocarpi TaxID=907779 RepID=A0ABV6JT73_9PROT